MSYFSELIKQAIIYKQTRIKVLHMYTKVIETASTDNRFCRTRNLQLPSLPTHRPSHRRSAVCPVQRSRPLVPRQAAGSPTVTVLSGWVGAGSSPGLRPTRRRHGWRVTRLPGSEWLIGDVQLSPAVRESFVQLISSFRFIYGWFIVQVNSEASQNLFESCQLGT